jgi:hypothetical protein
MKKTGLKNKIAAMVISFFLIAQIGGIMSIATDLEDSNNEQAKTSNVKVVVTADDDAGIMPDFMIVDHETLQMALDEHSFTVLPVRNDINLEKERGPLTIPIGRQAFTILPATGVKMEIIQANPGIRHFNINQNVAILFKDMELVGGAGSGGINIEASANAAITGAIIKNCFSDRGGAISIGIASLTLSDSKINNNSANNGGAIFMGNGAKATLDSVTISNNSATVGGGIGMAFAVGESDLIFMGSGVTFSGNNASTAFWIEKDSSHPYLERKAIDWKLLYRNAYVPFVNSLTELPEGIFPFGYMFNNYDVAYVGTVVAGSPPVVNRVVFSPDTNIPSKKYKGEANDIAQLLDLYGENKPFIEIFNTTDQLWNLSVRYTPFMVGNNTDDNLRFALRDETGKISDNYGNKYSTFNPNKPHLVYQAQDASFLYTVNWGDDNRDMLKVLLPEYRHDLRNKDITSVLTWSLEVTPQN